MLVKRLLSRSAVRRKRLKFCAPMGYSLSRCRFQHDCVKARYMASACGTDIMRVNSARRTSRTAAEGSVVAELGTLLRGGRTDAFVVTDVGVREEQPRVAAIGGAKEHTVAHTCTQQPEQRAAMAAVDAYRCASGSAPFPPD